MGYGCFGEDVCYIYDFIGCSMVFGRNKLVKNRYIVCIKDVEF